MRLTPHVASNHTLVRHVFLEKVGENLGRFVRGEELLDRVDPTLGYQAACGDRRRRRLDEALPHLARRRPGAARAVARLLFAYRA